MKLNIFKKGQELINSVSIDGKIREKIYLSIANMSECPECDGQGTTEDEDSEEDLFQDCITCNGSGKIDDSVKVCIANDGKKTYIESCTCTHHSIHQGIAEQIENKLMLCSYVIAAIKYLGNGRS